MKPTHQSSTITTHVPWTDWIYIIFLMSISIITFALPFVYLVVNIVHPTPSK